MYNQYGEEVLKEGETLSDADITGTFMAELLIKGVKVE